MFWLATKQASAYFKGTRGEGGKSHIQEVVAVILNDNKTALLKSVLKTVMDPPWWPLYMTCTDENFTSLILDYKKCILKNGRNVGRVNLSRLPHWFDCKLEINSKEDTWENSNSVPSIFLSLK